MLHSSTTTRWAERRRAVLQSQRLWLYAVATYGTLVAVGASAAILHESTYAAAVRTGAFSWGDAYLWMLVRYGSWLALVPVVRATLERIPLPFSRRSLVLFCALGVAACAAHRLGDSLARRAFAPVVPMPFLLELRRGALKDGPIDLLIYALMLGALAAYEAQRHVSRAAVREADAARSVERLQYQVLRAKVEPHFLFNALQSIATLIRRQPDRASALLLDLSEVLRAALQSGDSTRHSLADELTIVRAYLAIEQARFGPRLHATVEVDACDEAISVPALVLQPLVENAVRHGITPKHEGGRIEVRASSLNGQLVIRVRDDGVGVSSVRGDGIGLAAVRGRLATIFEDRASLRLFRDGGWTVAELRCPASTNP